MQDRFRQEALAQHGLTETQDGFELTVYGFRRASRRALALRKQGDREAARILALSPEDPIRWEYCRCIAIDSFTAETHRSEI
jgi:hypothetical protein